MHECALDVTRPFARFHAEEERSYPARQHARENALKMLIMAILDLLPPVRLEMI